MVEGLQLKPITVFVPGPLRERAGGVSELFLSAPNVRVALEILERQPPGALQERLR